MRALSIVLVAAAAIGGLLLAAPSTLAQGSFDLRAIDVYAEEPPLSHVETALRATIGNDGPAIAAPFTVRVISPSVTHQAIFQAMDANSVIDLQLGSINATAGLHEVRLEVDVNGNVTESNESNNNVQRLIRVEPRPADPALMALKVGDELAAHLPVKASVTIQNLGDSSTGNATLVWEIDGVAVRTDALGSVPFTPMTIERQLSAVATGGHVLTASLSAENDADTTNNMRAVEFTVPEPGRARIDIVAFERDPVPTEAGALPSPTGRFRVLLEHCSLGPGALGDGILQLSLVGGNASGGGGAGSATLPSRPLLAHAPGECAQDEFHFDAVGAIGDVALRVDAEAFNDPRGLVFQDSAESYRIVGGQGGVVLLAMVPFSPFQAVDQVEAFAGQVGRFANDTAGTASRFVNGGAQENASSAAGQLARAAANATAAATRLAEGAQRNASAAVQAAQATAANASAQAQNETQDPAGTVGRAVDPVIGAMEAQLAELREGVNATLEDLQGAPLTTILVTAENAACSQRNIPCDQYRGDYGAGQLRGCQAPGPQPNVPANLVYGAFNPDHRRVGSPVVDNAVGPTLRGLPETGLTLCEPTARDAAFLAAAAAEDAAA